MTGGVPSTFLAALLTSGGDRVVRLVCADGTAVSLRAGFGAYSSPEYAPPFTHVEVGLWSAVPVGWDRWHDGPVSPDAGVLRVFGYVPREAVEALVAVRGGAVVDPAFPVRDR